VNPAACPRHDFLPAHRSSANGLADRSFGPSPPAQSLAERAPLEQEKKSSRLNSGRSSGAFRNPREVSWKIRLEHFSPPNHRFQRIQYRFPRLNQSFQHFPQSLRTF
jgi:hypothetical protein